jgi:hypothetical protein
MASYAISSSLILVIHDNIINGTNHIVYHVFVDISRSQGCQNTTCQIEKIVYFSGVTIEQIKEKKTHHRMNRRYHQCISVGVVGTMRSKSNKVDTVG